MGALEDTQEMVQAAVDTADWIDAYTADVTVDGRRCRITIPLLAKSSTRVVRGVEIHAPLGRRPIRFDLGARGITHPAMPTERTGDAAFDDRFVIQGIPIEPLIATFDADTRGWAMHYFGEWPSLMVRDDDLELWHQTVFERKGLSTSPDKLRSAIEWALHIADRMTTEFDRAHDDVRRTSGQGAADQWIVDLDDTLERRDRRKTAIRVLVFAVFLFVLPAIAIWWTFSGL